MEEVTNVNGQVQATRRCLPLIGPMEATELVVMAYVERAVEDMKRDGVITQCVKVEVHSADSDELIRKMEEAALEHDFIRLHVVRKEIMDDPPTTRDDAPPRRFDL